MVNPDFRALVISSTAPSLEKPAAVFLINTRLLQISAYAGDNNTDVIAIHHGMARLV